MKKILIILIAFALHGCEECPAMDRFTALSMIESGDNDFAVGKAGEVSRYQILPAIWNDLVGLGNPKNRRQAFFVANAIMFRRVKLFEDKYHREPSDFEWYLLWHRPGRVLTPKPIEADRAKRFANLCSRK